MSSVSCTLCLKTVRSNGERFMIPLDFETHDLRNLGFSIRFISNSGEISTATTSSLFGGPMGAKQAQSYRVC